MKELKYAVISDIHGNYEAFSACVLDALENKCNAFLFLGDYGTDFLDMPKCLELMKKLCVDFPESRVVKGNREDYLINYDKTDKKEWKMKSTDGALLLAYNSLNKEDMNYIKGLPNSLVVNNSHGKILIKHNLPFTKEELNIMTKENIKTVLIGHMHLVGAYKKDNIKIYNPGSCGHTDDGILGSGTYGILEFKDDDWKFFINVVEYDYEKTINKIKNNKDLYEGCRKWGQLLILSIYTGRNETISYISEYQRLYKLYLENYQKISSKKYYFVKRKEFDSKLINGKKKMIELPILDYEKSLFKEYIMTEERDKYSNKLIRIDSNKVPDYIYMKALENIKLTKKDVIFERDVIL